MWIPRAVEKSLNSLLLKGGCFVHFWVAIVGVYGDKSWQYIFGAG